jgi:FlaA1/EpsC-like NDP-sugar epimerase
LGSSTSTGSQGVAVITTQRGNGDGVPNRPLPMFTGGTGAAGVGLGRACDHGAAWGPGQEPVGLVDDRGLHAVSDPAAQSIQGKKVLVLGAGGTVGAELCRQLSVLEPRRVMMLDHDEYPVLRLQLELRSRGSQVFDGCVADVHDPRAVARVFDEMRPDVVFHMAGHSRPSRFELHPCVAVRSYVLGVENVVRSAVARGADRFTLVSSDASADTSTVLGATGRLAELVVKQEQSGGTRVASVRVGDVLGLQNSLLSVLAAQIRGGHPVTMPHPDTTRSVMTPQDAACGVVEAAHLAGNGQTLALDGGARIRVLDVVESLAHLMHRDDVEIRFTGSGQATHHRPAGEDERLVPTTHPGIFTVAATTPPPRGLQPRLRRLYAAAAIDDDDAVRAGLRVLVPGNRPPFPTVPAQAGPPDPDNR